MCDVPRDIQRKFERRWAARFARPIEARRPERHQCQKPNQPVAASLKAQRKTGRIEPTDLSTTTVR